MNLLQFFCKNDTIKVFDNSKPLTYGLRSVQSKTSNAQLPLKNARNHTLQMPNEEKRCENLVRAVNRQPGLPPGMTRRALLSLLDTQRMHSIPYYSSTTTKSTVQAKVEQADMKYLHPNKKFVNLRSIYTFLPTRLLRRYDASRRPKRLQEAS